MKRRIKNSTKVLSVLCITLLFVNCSTEEYSEKEVTQVSNVNKAHEWFNKYESKGQNYDLFQNLEYNWKETIVTNSKEGTEIIIVPIIESKINKEEAWEQKLYLYKLDEDNYKALLIEFYPYKNAPQKNKFINDGNFNGYISIWDLKQGFVKSAKFVNNIISENGIVKVLSEEQLITKSATNKLAPKNLDDEYGIDGGGNVTSPTPLKEVVIVNSYTNPVFVYFPQSVDNSGFNVSDYTFEQYGSGGGTGTGTGNHTNSGIIATSTSSIKSKILLIATINRTNADGRDFKFVQSGNTIVSSGTIGLLPWVELVVSVTQTKVGDKYIVNNVTSNPIGLTTGISWSQTSYGKITNGNTTTVTIVGISSVTLFLESIGTIYSSPVSYSVNIDNKTGKLISAKRLAI